MQRTLIALGCALALASGSALAQQQQPQGSGPTLTERAKAAAQAVGDKTKEAAQKAKNAMQTTAESDDDKKSANSTGVAGRDADRMQKRADADLKSAKARCESIKQRAEKTLCEKQAIARHANAEVGIAKANLAAQGGNTATMGAGKSR